ncbi:hypothetical protein [Clostridium sp. C8-1-8]|uniref:hypothetical protein n=1 Tax=Clostridium sp. C8-1-8 TaxID=2698831 RepID=UPI00136A13B0|nr:hypothetical protein [Clostridium sp. C8-1-8]
MSKCIYYGEFNAEKYWRDSKLAKLPQIPDRKADNIVRAMDELLFILCDSEDTVLTRYKMDSNHISYLRELGIKFQCNDFNLSEDISKEQLDKNICQLLIDNHGTEINKIFSTNTNLETFAIIPEAYRVSELYGKSVDYPKIEVVKKVNSKIYSSNLNLKLATNNEIKLVYSSVELYEEGKKYLNKGSIIIKDSFGVSGKGNQIITSEGMLKRIVSYIEVQEKKGKKVELIVEPLLDKIKDFSCQFKIYKDGDFEILSIQEVRNTGLAYLGSYTPDKEFVDFIDKRGYFQVMARVAEELYKDGYYGDVCIDSMVLKDQTICPIVEINARRSMSLIKHNVDLYAQKIGLGCGFTSINVSFNKKTEYSDILEALSRKNILFRSYSDSGVMPLSSNTVFINRNLDADRALSTYKGRLYFSTFFKDISMSEVLRGKLIDSLKEVGINSSNN